MITSLLIMIVILIYGTTGQLHCGFPGRPQNGVVTIAFPSSKAVAKYQCPGSFIIDGDVERTCRDDGTWTGTIPRCATEVPVRKSLGHDGSVENLADGKLETCALIHEGNSVVLEFAKKFHMYGIKIIYPAPYKDSVKDAELDVRALDGERVNGSGVNRTFHERDPTFDNNDFLGVQWRLNGSGDAVRVGLVKGNAFLCEIKVFAYPGECGTLDAIHNGHVEYDNTSALCLCDTHYQVEGHSSVLICSDGRWSGEQCACRQSDTRFIVVDAVIITITLNILIFILFYVIMKFRLELKSWLLDKKNHGSFYLQLPFMKTRSSNAQCDELQKKMHNQIDPLLQPDANK